MKRIERLYAISEELRRTGATPLSSLRLADKFGVSRRTIERDLSSLREIGLPIYATAGRTGGSAVLTTDKRVMLSFSAPEAIGLLLSAHVAKDAPFSDHARSASQRIVEALDPDASELASRLVDRVLVAENAPDDGLATRRTLEEAVRSGVVVNIEYADAKGAATKRSVEAVGLYYSQTQWFLIGWCRLRHDRRLFRLDRVVYAHLTTEVFAPRSALETLGWVPLALADSANSLKTPRR